MSTLHSSCMVPGARRVRIEFREREGIRSRTSEDLLHVRVVRGMWWWRSAKWRDPWICGRLS